MSITFAVDDVPRAAEELPTRRFGDVLGERAICVGADEETRVVAMPGVHPLLGAVHLAFAQHRRLVLSPDAIWLTILQGVAQHVRLHADELRPRLVRHQGREAIHLTWQGPMPTSREGWRDIVDAFRAGIAERTGPGLARLLVCDFSTSTEVDRVASEIVLMDAVSPYFDYFLACVCGIPEVTLTGTTDDWKTLRQRIDILEELELRPWVRSLIPIADELVRASGGRPDLGTWRRIYKPRKAYGWDRITGWVARLFPYVKSRGTASQPNPLLDLPFSQPDDGPEDDWYQGPGIALEDAPCGPSSVLVRVEDAVRGCKEEIEARGGLMGIEQDGRGALRAVSAYVIRRHETGILGVIDRIVRDHHHAPDQERDPAGTAEQIALTDRLGAATLTFSGDRVWRLRRSLDRELVTVKLSDGASAHLDRWVDLPGGLFIGHVWTERRQFYVLADERCLVRPPREGIDPITLLPRGPPLLPERVDTTQPARDIPVLGESLAAILEHALDHDGELPVVAPATLEEWTALHPPPRA